MIGSANPDSDLRRSLWVCRFSSLFRRVALNLLVGEASDTDLTGRRTVRTVYYALGSGARISYSIVSGRTLTTPPNADRLSRRQRVARTNKQGGLTVVTLVRHGRTYVLAGEVPARVVVALATAPLLKLRRV